MASEYNLVTGTKSQDNSPDHYRSFTMNEKSQENVVKDAEINVTLPAKQEDSADDDVAVADGKDEKEQKQPMVGMLDVFRFADGKSKILIVTGILASVIQGACMPLMIIVFGEMTDTFVSDGRFEQFWDMYGKIIENVFNITQEDFLANTDKIEEIFDYFNMSDVFDEIINEGVTQFMNQMNRHAIYYTILGVVVLVVGFAQMFCLLTASFRQAQTIRTTLFHAILRQDIGWFDTHEIGELNSRLADDVNKIQDGIGDKLGQFFQYFSMFITGFIVGLVYGWKLTLVILSVSPLLAISGGIMAKLGTTFTARELKAYAKAGAVAEEVISSIRTVFAFGGEDKEAKRYGDNLVEAKKYGIRTGIINGGAMGLVFFIIFGSYALAFWYGTQLVIKGEYTGGNVLIVFFSVLIGAFSLGNTGSNFQYFAAGRGAAYAVYNIIDMVPAIDSFSEEGIKPDKIVGNIEFSGVEFAYPSRPDVRILKSLDLKVNVGQTVALVGSSGCGKSTTVQLIQRFYDVLDGSVKLDGIDVKDLNIKWLRRHIGVVSQEPILFATTIGENIRYGRDDVTDKEIENAARMANAHDFISKLPKKYETLVGERGAQLSGGQKQRIAIARALVRNPKILLLDEATSALDTESESIVQQALDKAREGRTTIVIAHRLSTVRTADVIAGFRDGRVVEQGTHDELMALGGIYHTLVTTQTHVSEEEDDVYEDIEAHTDIMKRQLSRTVSSNSSVRLGRKRLTSVSSDKAFERTMSVSSQPQDAEDEDLPEPSMTRLMKMNSPEWLYIVIGCVCAIINGGIQPAFAIIFSEIIGVFSEIDPVQQEKDALLYSMLFLAIGTVQMISMFLMAYMFALSGSNLTCRLRNLVFRTLLRQEIAYFDDQKNNTGALTTRLSTDASAVSGATGSRIATLLQGLSSIVIGLTIGFIYSWKLSLVLMCFGPFLIAAGFIQMQVMTGNTNTNKEALENAGKVASETIVNIRTVAQLTKEPHFYNEYKQLTEIPYMKNLKNANISGIAFGLAQALVFFAYAASFRFGAFLVESDGLAYDKMFRVVSAILFSAMAVGQASSFAPDYGKAKSAAGRVFALLDRAPDIDSGSAEGDQPTTTIGDVEFKEVTFSYPTRPNVQVLRGLNIGVKNGKTLALVGSSGCGKSTSIQLLERYYDALQGDVMVDNRDIRKLNISWLRRQIGLVQQEPILFDCSIRDNIAYGDNSRDVSMDEIITAAKDANIHNFISSLPQGYETNVGDKGAQLSGGQKQRIAIARALVRNPKILLLDEATSALDTESEKIVQEALDRAQQGRTCIVIAHRLSTIHDADCIAVIHNGKVVEQGTHSELMALQQRYYRLNMTQSKKQKS